MDTVVGLLANYSFLNTDNTFKQNFTKKALKKGGCQQPMGMATSRDSAVLMICAICQQLRR